jgi:hypothetical protein
VNVGEIIVLDSGGFQSTGSHLLTAALDNSGMLKIGANLILDGAVSHLNNLGGEIQLKGGILQISALAAGFTNAGEITGDGLIDNLFSTPLIQNGVIRPEPNSTLTTTATISFSGDVDVGPDAIFELDVVGLGSFDSVSVTGVIDFGLTAGFATSGSYFLNFMPGHGVGNGQTLSGVISSLGGISGDPDAPINHNLGAAYSLSKSTTTGTISFTLASSFDNTFTGSVDDDYETGANWSTLSVPTVGEDVLIGSTSSVVVSGTPAVLNSLSLEGTSDFAIASGGVLVLDQQSMFQNMTTFTVENGGTLELRSMLTNNGTFTWSGGTLTDQDGLNPPTSIFINQATIDLDTTANPSLGLALENRDNLSISGSGVLTETSVGSALIDNFGDLNVDGTSLIAVNINNHFDAHLNIQDTAAATLAGIVINDGTIDIEASSSGTATVTTMVTFTGPLTNNGEIVLENLAPGSSNNVILDVSSGVFDNNGVINFGGLSNGVLSIEAGPVFTNGGTIDVGTSATINGSGFTLDSSGGDISVSGGEVLTLSDNALIRFDSQSNIQGGGTIEFTGAPTLDVVGNVMIGITDFNLATPGSAISMITGSASKLMIGAGGGLTLNSMDVVTSDVDLVNAGTLNLLGNGVSIQGGLVNMFSGALFVNNVGASGSSLTSIGTSLDNHGFITLNQSGVFSNTISVMDTGLPATLTNFTSFMSTQSGTSIVPNSFQGIFDNRGDLHVDYSLELNAAGSVEHKNEGTIHVPAGQTLTLGTNNSLLSIPESNIHGFGTIDVMAPGVSFDVQGKLLAGEDGIPGILTILGDTQFHPTAEVVIEIAGATPGTQYGVVNMTTASLKGRLNAVLLSPFLPASGSFTILTATIGLLGSFDTVNGLDFDPTGTKVFDYDQSASDVVLTVAAVDFVGSPTPDILEGTAAAGEFLVGLDGDDELRSIASLDTAFGGAGDDKFIVTPGFKRIDGGDGFDVVEYMQSVDYRTVEGHVLERIEVISIDDGLQQIVEFDAASIARIIDVEPSLTVVNSALVIVGDDFDRVKLYGDFLENGERVVDVLGLPQLLQVFTEGDISLMVSISVETEIFRTDGSIGHFGSNSDDQLNGTGLNDVLVGRSGSDTIDGQGGADVIEGGPGNDFLVHNPGDLVVDGGEGVDTLLIDSSLLGGAPIDLTGVSNLTNMERLDMTNGTADTLSLDIEDLLTMVGDNSLDAFLPDGNKKMLVDGDASDTVILNGQDLSNVVGGALSGGVTSDFIPVDVLGNGELYVRFVDSTTFIDLYVHTSLVNNDTGGA